VLNAAPRRGRRLAPADQSLRDRGARLAPLRWGPARGSRAR